MNFNKCNIAADLRAICDKWLGYLQNEKGYSPHTSLSYRNDLESFFNFLQFYTNAEPSISSIASVTIYDVRSWLADLKNKHYATTSSARHLASLRNFFTYLGKFEDIDNKAAFNVKIRKISKALPKTIDSENSLLATREALKLNKEQWLNLRNYAIILLIYGCGLRISEALSICKSNLGGEFIVVTGKGNKTRSVPILPQITLAINQYLELCPYTLNNSEPLFLGKQGKPLNQREFRKCIEAIRHSLNLPEFTTPHAFRHGFASHLLASGADLRSIQELLGHKNLSTTQIYTQVDQKRIFDIYSKTHPRSH